MCQTGLSKAKNATTSSTKPYHDPPPFMRMGARKGPGVGHHIKNVFSHHLPLDAVLLRVPPCGPRRAGFRQVTVYICLLSPTAGTSTANNRYEPKRRTNTAHSIATHPLTGFVLLRVTAGATPPLLSRRVCNGAPQTQNVGRSKESRDAPGDEEASQIMAIVLSGLHQHPPTHMHTLYLDSTGL